MAVAVVVCGIVVYTLNVVNDPIAVNRIFEKALPGELS